MIFSSRSNRESRLLLLFSVLFSRQLEVFELGERASDRRGWKLKIKPTTKLKIISRNDTKSTVSVFVAKRRGGKIMNRFLFFDISHLSAEDRR